MTRYIKQKNSSLPAMVLAVLISVGMQAQTPSGSWEPSVVYVVDFSQKGTDIHFPSLTTFTPELIRLQLLQMPVLTVFRASQPPPCGLEKRVADSALDTSSQVRSGAASQAPVSAQPDRDRPAPAGNFFVISGSVDFHSLDISVDASLDRCEDHRLSNLTTDHALFVPGKALDELNVLSQFLVYKLQNSLPAVQIRVGPFRAANKRVASIAAKLTEQIKEEITQHPGFQLSDKASIVIGGSLLEEKGLLRAVVQISWNEVVKPFDVKAPASNIPNFLNNTGRSVFETLSAVMVSYSFGSQDYLEKSKADDLTEDGKKLLCIDQTARCRANGPAALKLLMAAVKKSPKDITATYYVAVAQASAVQYADAIATLTHLLQLIDANPGAAAGDFKIKSLNLLADLSTRQGDLKAAKEYYHFSLEAEPNQPEIYSREAEFIFGTNAVEAVDLLLSGLDRVNDKTAIHTTLRRHADEVKPPDFEAVADKLQAALPKDQSLSEEYAIVCAHAASNLVYSDPERTQQFLRRARELHPSHVTAENRNWLARIEAALDLGQKKYKDAHLSALNALTILPGDSRTVLLAAQIELAWANALQPQTTEQRDKLLNSAYSRLMPLVDSANEGAYDTFRAVGHGRKADSESLKVFSKLADNNPNDTSAVANLMFICGEYLMDRQCLYSRAKEIMTRSVDNLSLQLDSVEAAVVLGHYKEASQWLAMVDRHPEADPMHKFVTSFYRFWISYVENDVRTREHFQALKQSLNEYKETDQSTLQYTWSFEGTKTELKNGTLPTEKKKLLALIIETYENPKRDTSGLSLSPTAN